MKQFKRITSAVILLCTLQQSMSAESPKDQIQILINEGHLQQALKLADETLAGDESDIRILFLKGLILTKLNDLDNAQKLFEKLTNEHPELPEPFNNLAVIYAFKGEYDKAELALLTAINTHPSYATAHENLGDIYAKMATQAYNQALALDQENIYVKEKLLLVNELFSVPESPVAIANKEEKQEEMIAETKPVIKESPQVTPEEMPEVAPEEKPEIAPEEKLPVAPEAKPEEPPEVMKETEVVPPAQETASPKQESQQDDTFKTEVIMALQAWANAWSSRDMDAYLACYASEFVPPNKLSRKTWEARRKERLEAPQFIKVEISAINVVFNDNGQARIKFLQQYQSDTYSDRVTKEIMMKKKDGKWLITRELDR